MMIAIHCVCIFLDTVYKALEVNGLKDKNDVDPYKHADLQKMLVLLKIFIYFYSIMYTQSICIEYLDNREYAATG